MIPEFNNSIELAEEIKKMEVIGSEDFKSIEEKIKFRDMLTYIEGKYLCL
jgi:hypothetical protein